MTRQERTTRLVRRIAVRDVSGARHVVEEWGDFLRAQYNDLTWSEPVRSGGRLTLKGRPVNATSDENVLEVAETGERLTVIQPSA